jgi:hypothetical protein
MKKLLLALVAVIGALVLALMAPIGADSEATTAKVRPCLWPNPCTKAITVVKVKPCMWPNPCGSKLNG